MPASKTVAPAQGHVHEFKAGRSKTVKTCACGRFQCTGEPIAEQRAVAAFWTNTDRKTIRERFWTGDSIEEFGALVTAVALADHTVAALMKALENVVSIPNQHASLSDIGVLQNAQKLLEALR